MVYTVKDLMADDNIVYDIKNKQDWLGTNDDAKLFSMLNNLGNVEAEGNVKFGVNQTTGVPDDYVLGSTLTIAQKTTGQKAAHSAGDLNASTVDLETILQITSFALRPGMAFNLSQDAKEALVRIESGGTNAWFVRTINISTTNASMDFTSGATAMLSDLANYADGAPASQEFKPEYEWNAMQLIDFAYGNEMITNSQDTTYDNSIIIQGKEQMKRAHKVLNRAVLYNTDYTLPGLGAVKNSATMGLPGWLNFDNTSTVSSELLSNNKIDTGSTVDFWSMRKWGDKFSMGSMNKLCVTSATFSTKIAQAAASVSETVRTKEIEFPRFNVFVRQINLGNITLNLIVDRNLDKRTPHLTDGTLKATQKDMLFAIDRESFKLKYHLNDKLGLLTPTVRSVPQVNDERVSKMHIIAGMGTSLWKKPAHGVYALGTTI